MPGHCTSLAFWQLSGLPFVLAWCRDGDYLAVQPWRSVRLPGIDHTLGEGRLTAHLTRRTPIEGPGRSQAPFLLKEVPAMFWPSLLLYEQARYRQQELLQTAARNQLANSYRRVRRRQAKRGPGLLTRAAGRVFNTVTDP